MDVVKVLRKTFNSNITKSLKWRKDNLNAMMRLIEENTEELCEANKKDLNKHAQETILMELACIKNGIIYSLNNLEEWMKPQNTTPLVKSPLLSTYIDYQPYGVVLIIGAWNYPFMVTLYPIVGAIASGNCVLAKPSELSPHTSELMEKLWPKYFNTSEIAILNGGISETTSLLKERFDYIFYTGSTVVGKIIMEAASKHLTPVTLECGGKSPVYVDESADLNIAAKRILWARFSNAGQTCIAADYVLATDTTQKKLLPLMTEHLKSFYTEKPIESDSYGRIINDRHFQRLTNLIDKSKVVIGGESNQKEKFISPTIMLNCSRNDKVMQEEIFGPILPFVTVGNYQEAIDFINEGEKPLALYVFSNDNHVYEEFRNKTSSGGFGFNECLLHAALESIPFGGVGASGIGRYHGKHSFETFSHPRAVLKSSSFGESLTSFRYPPYNKSKINKGAMLGTEFRSNSLTKLLTSPYFLVAMVIGIAIYIKSKNFISIYYIFK